MHVYSNRGSSLVYVLFGITIVTVVSFSLIKLSDHYLGQSDSVKSKTIALSDHDYMLKLIGQKFQFNGTELPVWFPKTYPEPEDMLPNSISHPKIAVFQISESDKAMKVPTGDRDDGKKYVLDKSRMGSVEEKNSDQEYQKAFLAVGEITNLQGSLLANFLSFPNTNWNGEEPKDKMEAEKITIDDSKLALAEISFLKYVASDVSSAMLQQIQVRVGSSKNKRSLANTAFINISTPPEPKCSIGLEETTSEPLEPGVAYKFVVKADSITTTTNVIPNTFQMVGGVKKEGSVETFKVKNQSIANVGVFTQVAKTFEIIIPKDPTGVPQIYPGNLNETDTGYTRNWTLEAYVYGVNQQITPSKCEVHFLVKNPTPAPVCTLKASPPNIAIGQQTTLSLDCQYPVSSATINNVSVAYNPSLHTASLPFTRNVAGNITVYATANGPGGSTTVSTVVGATCKFNNDNYVESIPTPWMQNTNNRATEISNGPERSYPFQYSFASRYSVTRSYHYFGNSGMRRSACDQGSLCMGSFILGANDSLTAGRVTFIGHMRWLQFGPATQESCTLQKVDYRPQNIGCFLQGTKLLTEYGVDLPIEKLNVGDYLRNPIASKRMKIKKLTRGPEKGALWRVSALGNSITVTHDHPFLTAGGMKTADQLKKSDWLVLNGELVSLDSVKKLKAQKNQIVWNVEFEGNTDDDHFVLANGIPSGDLYLQKKMKGLAAK